MFYYRKKDIYVFDDVEKRQAHDISVLSYLEQNFGLTFKRAGQGYKCVEHNSLFIQNDEKRWYWNSKAIGGTDAVALVQKLDENLEPRAVPLQYDRALYTIMKPIANETTSYSKAKPKDSVPEKKELQLPKKKDGQYNRVYAYLTKTRGIDRRIIDILVEKKYIYEDVKGNCVFIGKNKFGKPVYAALRTTATERNFRIEAEGSDKTNGFYLRGFKKDTVYVFEAPIDLLSHATLENMSHNNPKAWLQQSRLSLGGVSDNALEHYLINNPSVQNIVLCLDSDLAGLKAVDNITAKYSEKGYNVSAEPPAAKDYNEMLQAVLLNKKAAAPVMK